MTIISSILLLSESTPSPKSTLIFLMWYWFCRKLRVDLLALMHGYQSARSCSQSYLRRVHPYKSLLILSVKWAKGEFSICIDMENYKQLSQFMHKECGKITLTPNPNSEYPIINVHLNVILDNLKWSLSDGRYRDYELPQLIPYIRACHVAHLVLNRNEHHTILKELAVVPVFSDLRSLNLKNNCIRSIECLCRVNMPQIENLWLGENQITTLRPFRRVSINFPMLEWLSLELNPVTEWSHLVEGLMKTEQLYEEVPLTMLEIGDDKSEHILDFRWSAKVSPHIQIMIGCETVSPESKKALRVKEEEPCQQDL